MTAHWTIVATCWLVFVLYWNVSALRMRAPKRVVPWTFTVPNTALLYAGFILALMRGFDVEPLATRVAPSADGFRIAATLLVVAGLAFAVWSRIALGANWSATVRIHADQRVVRTGPYALVAHPIYTGISLALLGSALVGGTLGGMLGVVLVVVSFWMKARMEERFLQDEFGAAYAEYRRGVKFLIPFVW